MLTNARYRPDFKAEYAKYEKLIEQFCETIDLFMATDTYVKQSEFMSTDFGKPIFIIHR